MNDPNDIIFAETFRVRAHEVDVNKNLTIPALLKIMQEASMGSAEQLNVSVWDLEKSNLSWVLLRKKVTVHEMPRLGETVIIKTNPSGFDRALAYRDYRAFNEEGKILAQASSTWALLDLATRKMVRTPQQLLDLTLPSDILDRPESKIPAINKSDAMRPYQIGYYDLDWNGHVNNINFVRYMLEVLPLDILQNHKLQDFLFQIKSECFLNQNVVINAEYSSEKEIIHQLMDSETKNIIALGLSKWA